MLAPLQCYVAGHMPLAAFAPLAVLVTTGVSLAAAHGAGWLHPRVWSAWQTLQVRRTPYIGDGLELPTRMRLRAAVI